MSGIKETRATQNTSIDGHNSQVDDLDNQYDGILFKIEKPGMAKPSYIQGTVHLPVQEVLDFYPEYSDAFLKADNLIIEVNPYSQGVDLDEMLKTFVELAAPKFGSKMDVIGDLENEVFTLFAEGVQDGSVLAMFNALIEETAIISESSKLNPSKLDMVSMLTLLCPFIPLLEKKFLGSIITSEVNAKLVLLNEDEKEVTEDLEQIISVLDLRITQRALKSKKKIIGLEKDERTKSLVKMVMVLMIPFMYAYVTVYKGDAKHNRIECYKRLIEMLKLDRNPLLALYFGLSQNNLGEKNKSEANKTESSDKMKPNTGSDQQTNSEQCERQIDAVISDFAREVESDLLTPIFQREQNMTLAQALVCMKDLLLMRNKEWLPKIIQLLESGKSNFIAVGMAHLVRLVQDQHLLGRSQEEIREAQKILDEYGNGLIDMLRKKGYTVTRIDVPHIRDHKSLYQSVMEELLEKTPQVSPIVFSLRANPSDRAPLEEDKKIQPSENEKTIKPVNK